MNPRRSQPSYHAPALQKGLDILEALADSPVPLTLAELARGLSRTSSELFRMVDALEKRSYIARDPVSGGYRLTLKLYELAHTHSALERLQTVARLPMRALAESVHETCLLAVLSRGSVMILEKEESPDRIRLSVELGSLARPLHTISGPLLIAFLSPEEQEQLLSADPDYSGLTRARKSRFRRQLREIRRQGHVIAPSETRTGKDLAVIVGSPKAGIVASLAMPCLAGGRNEGKERHLLAALRKCAHRINESLGLSEPALTASASQKQ